MRISDWSSDVCSSDLADLLLLCPRSARAAWRRQGQLSGGAPAGALPSPGRQRLRSGPARCRSLLFRATRLSLMSDQKNLIIAIALSVAILLGFQLLVEAPKQDRLRQQQAAQQTEQQANIPQATGPAGSEERRGEKTGGGR